MMKTFKEYQGSQRVELVERDGKYVLEFDDIPSLLFVSYDGNGQFDQLFVNGEWQNEIAGATIDYGVGEVTMYYPSCYAITMKDEEENKDVSD